jgi:HK97 gp10 family phage protein
MADFVEAKLAGNLEADIAKFEADVKEKVMFSGVAAMAKVIYDEVKLNASPPRLGKKTGNLEASIYRAYSPEKSSDAVKTYNISWNKRKAPHGHLVEFGTSRAPAHPFVRPAFARINEAIEAGKQRMSERLNEVSVGAKDDS